MSFLSLADAEKHIQINIILELYSKAWFDNMLLE